MSREQETQSPSESNTRSSRPNKHQAETHHSRADMYSVVSEEEPGASSEGIAPVGIEVPSMKRLNKMCYHFRIADQQ
ncbi:uncharacterized protein [Nothobranchius furzeri]|uniref:uncharacterized protein isoform X6 n=1 Tax=Nothobranchius furzeri TaxID=105023 RepID=UPI0039046558